MADFGWWKPENLEIQQLECQKIDDLSALDSQGDFGSYRKVLLGNSIESSGLASHNDLNPEEKILYVHSLIKKRKSDKLNILDVGCGAGFTSESLGVFYDQSNVTGVDISQDGIEYAKKKHHKANFICQMVDSNNSKIGCFDLIYAFEFYPFTRTNDFDTHTSFLRYFLSQLNLGGELVLYQKWNNIDSVANNLKSIKKIFPDYSFDLNFVPYKKIKKIVRNRLVSIAISMIIGKIQRRSLVKVLIISKHNQ